MNTEPTSTDTQREKNGTGSLWRIPSGDWRVRWYDIDGRRRSRTFKTKQLAERFRHNALVKRDHGLVTGDRGDTVRSMMEQWTRDRSADGVRPATESAYDLKVKQICSRIGDVRLADLDFATLRDFQTSLAEHGYAPATSRGIMSALRSAMADAVRRNRMNPVAAPPAIKVPKRQPNTPTLGQVDAIAAAINPEIYSMVVVAALAGPRLGELVALRRSDVELDNHQVWIERTRSQKTGRDGALKAGQPHHIDLVPAAEQALRVQLAEHTGPNPDDLVWPGWDNQRVYREWVAAVGRSGVNSRPRFRFHDLRHTCASMMIAAELPVTEVAAQLGHTNTNVTLATYAHLWERSAAADYRRNKMALFLEQHAATEKARRGNLRSV